MFGSFNQAKSETALEWRGLRDVFLVEPVKLDIKRQGFVFTLHNEKICHNERQANQKNKHSFVGTCSCSRLSFDVI